MGRPKLPAVPDEEVDAIAPSWFRDLVACLSYAMEYPRADNKTIYKDASDTLRVQFRPSSSGGTDSLYDGFFKVTYKANTLTVQTGFTSGETNPANAGYVGAYGLVRAVPGQTIGITLPTGKFYGYLRLVYGRDGFSWSYVTSDTSMVPVAGRDYRWYVTLARVDAAGNVEQLVRTWNVLPMGPSYVGDYCLEPVGDGNVRIAGDSDMGSAELTVTQVDAMSGRFWAVLNYDASTNSYTAAIINSSSTPVNQPYMLLADQGVQKWLGGRIIFRAEWLL